MPVVPIPESTIARCSSRKMSRENCRPASCSCPAGTRQTAISTCIRARRKGSRSTRCSTKARISSARPSRPPEGRRSLQPETLFSPDYVTARDRFRRAARAGGAWLDELKLDARGPRDEPLAIDIATIGAEDARRLVLQTVGVHGVEAYAGSAIQLAALADLRQPPPGCALVLVHVLNPFGMAWLRRVNEHNVDL